jgi:betaine-aldehyde dehydrogenase
MTTTDVRQSRARAGRSKSRELTITDPKVGTLVGRMAVATPAAVAESVTTAREAFSGWSKLPAAARGLAVRAAAHAVAERAEELAELNTRETGRPPDQARAGVDAGVDTLLQYAELGPVHRGKSLRGDESASDYTVHEPRGVMVAVTPWNDPIAVAAGLLGAALVSGNTVVHKPSERCPHLGALFGRVLAEELPPGVLTTVTGDAATGAQLVALPGVDVIAHVGSTATGQAIARSALLTGAHVIRENGGNDALVIDAGVDPLWAAQQAALGAFAGSGQICTSVERIYVHRDVADAFVTALVAEATTLNDSGQLGPLVDERLRVAVHSHVRMSVALGARRRVGGVVPGGPGSFYPATVLTDCTPAMPVMAEETFGPVAPVQVVADFAEGLRAAADNRYGLAATVLTASIEHAHLAVHELPVGTVKVNAVFGGAPGGSAQPRGDSGSGYGYGPELLDEMTTTKVVHVGDPVTEQKS